MSETKETSQSEKERFSNNAKLYAAQVAEIADNLGEEVKNLEKEASMNSLLIAAAAIHRTIVKHPRY